MHTYIEHLEELHLLPPLSVPRRPQPFPVRVPPCRGGPVQAPTRSRPSPARQTALSSRLVRMWAIARTALPAALIGPPMRAHHY